MGYKYDDRCLNKAFDEEQLFVLLTRDKNAPATVINWIANSIHDQPEEKLREAFECAMQMKREHNYFLEESVRQKFSLPPKSSEP